MKKLMIMAVALLALTACGGNKNQNHGTHVHEDGSVHENHAPEATPAAQETFKVEADTTVAAEAEKHHDHGHDHGHDHNHPHQH